MSKNTSYLSGRKGLQENLFERLGREASGGEGIRNEQIEAIAEEFLLGNAYIFGTTSFYDFTRTSNAGKQIYSCNGSACLVAGTQNELEKKLRSRFTVDQIGNICCLGRCYENHAFQFKNKNYSGKASDRFEEIIQDHIHIKDQYPVHQMEPVVLTRSRYYVTEFEETLKKALAASPSQLLEEVKRSGLRGRGGAGFPMWIKLDGCLKEDSPQKFLVCNADEGDPGSFTDKYILEHQAFLLLAGMLIASYIIGANQAVVYIRAEYPESVEAVLSALKILGDHHLVGGRIAGTEVSIHFTVIKAQGAYICGEETALLSSIEGQRPEVRVRPPFPVQEGLFRKPTVVNNVETLACLPYIIDQGGAAFGAIGTEKSTGTKLISLDSGFSQPGVAEVPMGTPLSTVVNQLAGGFSRPTKALHIGGPLGGLLPVSKINDLNMDFESFSSQGLMLGHASIISIPEEMPMIHYLEHLFDFTAHESCGKCFPCRIGSTRGKELIQKSIQDTSNKIDKGLMLDLLDTMKRGSLCALGGGIPLPVQNAMQYFETELAPYFKS
jgi:NADH-quinone oxidoreductase subunit F